ncbi:CotS family spore coat protein [Defluviitalea phaphyphila]|uniref:CotS family spore coat protein n=1 Tax=Defluviitalea phaphyphila TaxID=1473580 RepID=UPI0007302F73|nr:CotS family spore coat protein [Defluviitalea phaphyphila]
MKELNPEILKGFGCKLKKYVPFRSSFICETDKGVKLIKPIDKEISKLLFEYSIKEHLYKNGFKYIDRYHVSDKNTPYYIYKGIVYTMTEWIDGRECDFNNLYDIKKAFLTLGEMHKVSKGLEPIEGSSIKYYNKNLRSVFEKRIGEISKIKKKINRQSHLSDFDILFLKNYKEYEELSYRALEWFNKSNYNNLVKKIDKGKYFYHNHYTYHNLIISSDENLYVTHFENCKYGFPIYDLVYILKKIMKRHEWDIKLAHELLLLYNKKIDIEEEKNLLISLLIFPHDFFKICSGYYNFKKSWVPQIFIKKLELIIKQKRNVLNFVDYIENL